MFFEYSNIKFHKNPSSGSRVRADRHDEAFRNFANAPKNARNHTLINTISAIVHDVEVSVTFHLCIWPGFLTRRTAHRKLQPVLTKKVVGVIGNKVPVNSGIHTQQISPKNYMQLSHDSSKRFASLNLHHRSIFKNLLKAQVIVNWRQFCEVKLNLYFKCNRYDACLLFCYLYCQ
jgi:hypothetical protein